MNRWAILKLGEGNFDLGFRARLQIFGEEPAPIAAVSAALPPNGKIRQFYRGWQGNFRGISSSDSRLGSPKGKKTNFSQEEERERQKLCRQFSRDLSSQFNLWLDSEEFRPIEDKLLAEFERGEEIRLVIQTADKDLRRLPWQQWDFFDRYPKAEAALSAPDFESPPPPAAAPKERVSILAILGNSAGINIEADRQFLQNIPAADVEFLAQPSRAELSEKLAASGWDILFFAGHSRTAGESGYIDINPEESLAIADLRVALQRAIGGGLQLAIFNSCDGLGIAADLESLQIPQTIVMREPVPDRMAQAFLKEFLSAFADGTSLYLAVRLAREQLDIQGWEETLPGSTQLPAIVQNPARIPPTWLQLGGIPACPYRGLSAFYEEHAPFFFGQEAFSDRLERATNEKPLVAVVGSSGSGKSSAVFAGLLPKLRQRADGEEPLIVIAFRPKNDPFEELAIALSQKLNFTGNGDRPKPPLKRGAKKPQSEDPPNPPLKTPSASLPPLLQGGVWGGSSATFDKTQSLNTAEDIASSESDRSLGNARQSLEETQEKQRLFPSEIADELRGNAQALAQFIGEMVREQPGSRIVLVADQFEELYTLSEERERGEFLQVLLNAVEVAPAFVLVLTLRADFYGQALSSPLGKALQEYAPESLIPMEPEQLQRAIAKPAELYKVQLEAGLIELILDDVKSQPGRLPLLEFALTQLWKKQQGGWLTRAAYEDIEGVEGALARQAEQFYAVLDSAERKQLERVLIQLVHPGAGTEDTRRVATREDLKENWDLVARLASARLVVSDRAEAGADTVEIVHEALLKSWGRLRRWIDDNREFRTWQDGLERDKEKWQQNSKDDGYLLREAPLLVARDWLQQRGEEISDSAREFIESSWALREAEIRKEKQRQRNRILSLSVFSAFASVLAVVAGVGWYKSAIGEINLIAQSAQMLHASERYFDGLLEGLRAAKQVKQMPGKDVETLVRVAGALNQAIDNVKKRDIPGKYEDFFKSVAISPDGSYIATSSRYKNANIWTLNGELLATLDAGNAWHTSIAISPDGSYVFTFDSNQSAKIWSPNGELLATLDGHKSSLTSAAISPDGSYVATGSQHGTAKLWSRNGELLATLDGHYGQIASVAISPDGSYIATASSDTTAKLWSLDGELLATLDNNKGSLTSVAISPDGSYLATVGLDWTPAIWSRDGDSIATLDGHTDLVNTVAISPDGSYLATASWDNTAKLWSRDGGLLATLDGHSSPVIDVAISPDGSYVATASRDNTAKLWNRNGELLATLEGHSSSFDSVAISPDGSYIATASRDNTTLVWNQEGKLLASLKSQDLLDSLAISPDGSYIATARYNTANLWSREGKALAALEGHNGSITSLAISSDGSYLATGGSDNAIKLWSRSGELLATLKGHSALVSSVAISSDGSYIVTASWDKTAKLWSRNGDLLATLEGHRDSLTSLAISPDGFYIVTASWDKTARLWSRNGDLLATLEGHRDSLTSLAISPDGSYIVTASWDKTAKLWGRNGDLLATLEGHRDSLTSVAFSPDGSYLATASRDKTVRIWSQNGGLLATAVHSDVVNRVTFSPSGLYLAATTIEGTVKIWSVKGRLLATLVGGRTRIGNNINNIAFSPDGSYLAGTTAWNNNVKTWSLDLDVVIDSGCNLVRDYLTYNPNVEERDRRLCD